MLYIITYYDEITRSVGVHSVIKDDKELANHVYQNKLVDSSNSKTQSQICSRCPIYNLSLTEEEALNLARKCQSFDFDEVNFDCLNVDNGVEATRHYFLSCVDVDF